MNQRTFLTQPKNRLPANRFTWTQPTVEPNTTFVQSNVKRRVSGETAWVVIAEIADIATNFYDDFAAEPNTRLEYTVTQSVLIGSSVIESVEADPVAAVLCFRYTYIHATNNPEVYCCLGSFDFDDAANQDTTVVFPRKQTLPTAIIGPARWHVTNLQGMEGLYQPSTVWDDLEALQAEQGPAPDGSGSAICVRAGEPSYRRFVAMTRLTRRGAEWSSSPNVEFTQTRYTEAVA